MVTVYMPGDKQIKQGDTNQPPVKIRAARSADFDRARDIQWSAGWMGAPELHSNWPMPDSEWVANRYFQELVAEVDGVIAGRVGIEAFCPPFAELINLCVRPEFRRMGIGDQLTLAGQEIAARMGFTQLFLQTEIYNSPAHHLYTSQGWSPTAHGAMLRMVKLFDYPLLSAFKRAHPLCQYRCAPVEGLQRTWQMEWYAYVTSDYLRLTLESGASQSDSDGRAPAISGLDWCVLDGARNVQICLHPLDRKEIEPGDYVEFTIKAANRGKRQESGVFQVVLPHGIRVVEPETNLERSFVWSLEPGDTLEQEVVVHVDSMFDNGALWHLNYPSVPICVDAYWEGERALLSFSAAMTAPPPIPHL